MAELTVTANPIMKSQRLLVNEVVAGTKHDGDTVMQKVVTVKKRRP